MSLAALLDVLRRAGLTPTPLEVAEALWLAQHLAPRSLPPPPFTPAEEPLKVDPADLEKPDEVAPPPPVRPAEQVPLATPSSSAAATPMAGVPVRAPGPPGLANRRDLQRALRPLRRRVPSRRPTELDVPATVAYVAGSGLWSPVLRPARERWFDVLVAVDTSASMNLWRHLGEELRAALVQTGAFRDVRLCRLHPDPDGCTVELGAGGVPRSPRELIDGAGRRLFLVLTDGAAAGWHQGAATRTLAEWGETGPVAVLQPLPEEMWSRTGLPAVAARLTSTTPGAPNSRLRAVYRRRAGGMALPVLGIEPTAIAAWAALIAYPSSLVPLAVAPGSSARSEGPEAGRGTASLDDFRATASPAAFRLAVCLSLVPLSLPVMRLVQHVAVPSSAVSTLAEVVLSGLVTRTGDETYEFRAGVRDRLAGELRRSEIATVLSAVSAWIAENAGVAGRTFPALAGGDGRVAADPFTWVPPAIAARLGLAAPAPVSAPAARYTLIGLNTVRPGRRQPSPEALLAALKTAFRAAGHSTDLLGLTSETGVTVSTTVDPAEVIDSVFNYVGAAVWAEMGLSDDDFTGVRLAMLTHLRHDADEPFPAAIHHLQRLLDSAALASVVGDRGRQAGLIVTDEVMRQVRDRVVPGRHFHFSAADGAWIHTAPIPGIEALPPGFLPDGRPHGVDADLLAARRAELEKLTDFVAGDSPYLWLQGGPGSGKTPLLGAFVMCAPGDADVVSWFFTDAPVDLTSPRLDLSESLAGAKARGRRLILVADGIDEVGDDLAGLLPPAHPNLRVIVSSRTGFVLPTGIPADHPIRHCEIHVLASPPVASTVILIQIHAYARHVEVLQGLAIHRLTVVVRDTMRRLESPELEEAFTLRNLSEGVILTITEAVPARYFLAPFIRTLRHALAANNASHRPDAMLLRMAVHRGPVRVTHTGVEGSAVDIASRLIRAPASIQAIAGYLLGAVLSEDIHREVTDRNSDAEPLPDFFGLLTRIQEEDMVTWVYVPEAVERRVDADLTRVVVTAFQVDRVPARSERGQRLAQETLGRILDEVCAEFHLPGATFEGEDVAILRLPDRVSTKNVIELIPRFVRHSLSQHNATSGEGGEIAVRIAAHEIDLTSGQWNPWADTVPQLRQLLNAPALTPGFGGRKEVGLIVSDALFTRVDADELADSFVAVFVESEPQRRIKAWLRTGDRAPGAEDEFRGMLERLPRGQRRVMELIIDGVPPHAVASQLGLKPSVVQRESQRARTTMRGWLRDRDLPS